MSFVSRNHPQQTAVRGPLDEVDDRGTDPLFFASLEAWDEWNATVSDRTDLHYLQHARGLAPYRIVMLLPANRCEQAWWQDHVEPHLRARRPDFRVEFLRGRMRFDRPGWTKPTKGDRPPFGCCLLIWGPR